MTRTARIAKVLAASVVAALALCAAATAGGPTISAGYGCAVACIESALVTPTASSASVEVKTSVPASVTVTASRLDAELALATGTAPKHVSVAPFLTTRTVLLPGLEPETTYRIVVSAKDLQGRVQTRSGTFTTRKVKVAVDLPAPGLSAGLGCKADCIQRGTFTADEQVPGRARLELEASVPATFVVRLYATKTPNILLDQRTISTASRKTAYSTTLDGLLTGTRYGVTAWATDANGNTHVEYGSFRTRSAEALVTVHKIAIVADGDKGVNRGEISLDVAVQDDHLWSMGFRRLSSGDTFAPKFAGTSRPGVWTPVNVDGLREIELSAGGVECDGHVFLSGCMREAGLVGSDWESRGSIDVDLADAFVSDGSLPPGYGNGLPAGQDAYAIFDAVGPELRFRVYATVDVRLS
jgi:hypothetical protein